jgi:N-acetylmuramoyl-L-alanine amidase
MKYGINSNFNYSDNTISFSTSDEINSGIDLENLSIDNYYLLLKVTYSNSDIKYYSLENSSEYSNITYYTITKNNTNNKIDISFDKYNDIPYMSINVTKANELPENVYDIAIDPGHGGLDKGATSNNYIEAEIVLNCALQLKTKLENLGLKVFISRDETSSSKEDTANNMYEENGRVNIINGSNAKLMISLHMNDTTYNKNKGGVEVYAPNDCNLEFASLLAKNIVENASSYYSEYTGFKKLDRCICS